MRVGLLVALALAGVGMSTAVRAADPFDWSGFYVTGNLGYTSGTAAAHYSDPVFGASYSAVAPLDSSPTGWTGGLGLGGNQQLPGGIVLGVEGDVSYGNVGATIHDELAELAGHGDDHTITSTTDWSGTLRARAGIAVGNVLPYLTAGLAVANATVSATDGPLQQSAVLSGWTAGGGVQFALDSNWSARGELLYTDLGSHDWFAGQTYQSTAHSTSTTIRFGASYKF